MTANKNNFLAMLNGVGYNPESVALYFEGYAINLTTDPIARFFALFEKERQARLAGKPFNFQDFLQYAEDYLFGSISCFRRIHEIGWEPTKTGFKWPLINNSYLFIDEVFVIKLAIIDSIWALKPSIFCDTDFSEWLDDTSFSILSECQAETQVKQMLEQVETKISERFENDKNILSILKALKYESLTRASLMKSTGFNRTFLDTHAIKPALKAGLIERTEKKPSSPKQEYKITSIGLKVLSNRTCI